MSELDKGWNLISLPKQPQDNTIGNIFGNRTVGEVWTWDNANKSFFVAQEITPDKGGNCKSLSFLRSKHLTP